MAHAVSQRQLCSLIYIGAKPMLPANRLSGRACIIRKAVRLPVARASAADLYDDIDWTKDLPVPIRRRVAALREVQEKYDAIQEEFIKEMAELEASYMRKYAPLQDQRVSIIQGQTEVGKYDVPDSEEKDEGIPEFWLTAMTNHELIGDTITERDAAVLAHLVDVRTEVLTGEDAGSFKLVFTFEKNPFISNKTLEKTFLMDNPEEMVPKAFVGCPIDWAPGKDTTTQPVKRRVQDKKLKGKAPAVTVTKTEPCDSFFNFFKTPPMPENPEDLTDEELESVQQKMDEDFELGLAFRESLIPRAVLWYTGEAAPPFYDDEVGEDDFEEYQEPARR